MPTLVPGTLPTVTLISLFAPSNLVMYLDP